MPNTNIAICATNVAKTAALSVDTQVASLPITNLAGDQGASSMSWRSGNTNIAHITATFAAAATVQAVSFHRANFTAQIRWSIVLYLNNKVVVSYGAAADGSDNGTAQVANCNNGQIIYIFSQAYTADTMKLELWEPSGNPDGYLSAGMLFVGPIWQPKRNFDYSSTYGRSAIVDETKSINGMEFPQYRNQQRVLKISHQSLGYEETPALDSIFAVAMTGTNILVVPDLTPANINNRTVFGRMVPDSITNPFGGANRSGASFTITERL